MGNPEHLNWLFEGATHWNIRRAKKRLRPDLSFFDIKETFGDIRRQHLGRTLKVAPRIFVEGANLSDSNLAQSDFSELNLRGVDFRTARLNGANLEYSDLTKANFSNASMHLTRLDKAKLLEANLSFTDLSHTKFGHANLEGASLFGAKIRCLPKSSSNDHKQKKDFTVPNLSHVVGITKSQLSEAEGDKGVLLPPGTEHPENWPDAPWVEENGENESSYEAEETNEVEDSAVTTALNQPLDAPPLKYLPVATFVTIQKRIDVQMQYKPVRPVAREASNYPIDLVQAERSRSGLWQLCSSLQENLDAYQKEETANRVTVAEQISRVLANLSSILTEAEEDFLPTLLEDYVETLALSFGDDVVALETADQALLGRIVDRGRKMYALYPEIAELSDPSNSRFFDESFPYSARELEDRIRDIVFSDEGKEFFTEKTRELVDAEANARVPAGEDADKSKLARFGGIVGALWHEMQKYAERAKANINSAHGWLKTWEKVEQLWGVLKPFIGLG